MMPYPSKWLLFAITIIFIGLNAAAAKANKFTITCQRTVLATQGFAHKSIAETWFPKMLTTSARYFKPISNTKGALRHSRTIRSTDGVNYQFVHTLLPDGRLVADIMTRAGYKGTGASYYHCDMTADEVRKLRKDLAK